VKVEDGATRLDPATLRLVAVTDSLSDGVDGLAARAAAAVLGGATMLQLRLKDESARTLVEVARALLLAAPGVPLLVNDRADVALAAGAHGVHLGVDDPSAAAVRRIVPAGFIIGSSVGDDADVERATGADYVGIGPVYPVARRSVVAASIGPERFAQLAARCGLPAVAIGGITPDNAAAIMAVGAAGVAVFSALLGAPEPARAARGLRAALDASGR
jgi:thiamine-phosphate pyrophosphorylase